MTMTLETAWEQSRKLLHQSLLIWQRGLALDRKSRKIRAKSRSLSVETDKKMQDFGLLPHEEAHEKSAEYVMLTSAAAISWYEAERLRRYADKLGAEGRQFISQGYKLQAESLNIWAQAVLATRGNIDIKWKPLPNFGVECTLDDELVFIDEGIREAAP